MSEPLYIITSDRTDPYYNLALEETLLSNVTPHSVILYLWQNQHTVVIGCNQNSWAECRTDILQEEGGHLARRLSGGGAVYHDLGNLNFTFLCSEEDYDLQKQLSVIQKAVSYAGITAEFSGRNDLLTEGCKFSGNAFYHKKGKAYHHGTILVNADFTKLSRYLSPPKAKLEAKGIQSVRSRVINLRELSPNLTIDIMKAYMVQAFSEVYGATPQVLILSEEDHKLADSLSQKYATDEWLFGKPIPFTCNLEGKLSFGYLQIQLCVTKGLITDLQVYTDAMDTALAEEICSALRETPFRADAMKTALSHCHHGRELKDFISQQSL